MSNEDVQQLVKNKLDLSERIATLAHTAGSIICSLAKHLIKDSGYSVASTVMTRELRSLGRKDARKYMEIFEIKERSQENASKILKIAATLLGLKLIVEKGETKIVQCPYGSCVKEFKEPFICNVCLEYCRGIVEEVLGSGFTFERIKWMVKGDEYCTFEIRKRR